MKVCRILKNGLANARFFLNVGNDAKDTSITSDSSDKSKPDKRKVIIISDYFLYYYAEF